MDDFQYSSDYSMTCLSDVRRGKGASWPPRCAVPCVQYNLLDEPYFDTDVFPGATRVACPCGLGLTQPYTIPYAPSNARAVATQNALLDWWDVNIHEAAHRAAWTNASWTAQGGWLGGTSLRDATWDPYGSSYCSWPFLECGLACQSDHALQGMDFRNASLYVPQLDFTPFSNWLTEAQRRDVWYM